MANFYMLPKIQKSEESNIELKNRNEEYIEITNIKVVGRPVVAGPIYCTHKLSTLLHIILSPALELITHFIKDTFDLKNKACKDNIIGMKIGVADIKSLYTNINHDLLSWKVCFLF